MVRLIVESFLLIALAISHQAYSLDKQDRIAIIGAGVSGLSAAWYLEQQGYSNFLIFEKNDRVGGKVYTFDYEGMNFDVGAFWVPQNAPFLKLMIERYALPFDQESVDFLVKKDMDQDAIALARFPVRNFKIWQLLLGYYKWRQVYDQFFYLTRADGFLQPHHDDLSLAFSEFIEKYEIEVFASLFRPFWIACGYGYYEQVPAFYVLKLMLPVMSMSLKDMLSSVLPWNNRGLGLLRSANGYQQIFDALAADLGRVRLNSLVTRVERNLPGAKPILVETQDGALEYFDYLVIAHDLSAVEKYLDMDPLEKRLVDKINYYKFSLKLLRADVDENAFVMFDMYGTPDTTGHLVSMIQRHETPGYALSLQIYPPESMDLTELLYSDINAFGGRLYEVVENFDWNYFPHVSGEDLASGYYSKLMYLQGRNRTYFLGSIFNFETVEMNAEFSKFAVENLMIGN